MGRDSDSWFTPGRYLAAVRSALGGEIDLDPYTSEAANRQVRARLVFTTADPAPEGALWPRCETCFMNPPYRGAGVLEASLRFVAAFRAGCFARGIVLVNNGTETRCFHGLLREARAVCFPDHRIAFENQDGKRISGNTRGQAFFYFHQGKGQRAGTTRFAQAFAGLGPVLGCGAALLKGGGLDAERRSRYTDFSVLFR